MIKNIGKLMELDFEEIKIIKDEFDEEKRVLTLHIKGVKNVRRCPICGSGKIKRYGEQFIVQKGVRHSFMTTYVTIELDIYKRRFICEECSKKKGKSITFSEQFTFLEKGHDHTKMFESYILQEWRYSSVLELSRKFKVSDKRIWDIIRNIDCNEILSRNIEYLSDLNEIYLGIDEHSFRGQDYVLIITELTTGKIIGVLPKITQEYLKAWLNNLPAQIMQKIKGYATDMHKGYATTVKEVLGGNSLHSVDPAHLVFLGNKITDQVRQMNDWMIKMGYFEKDRKIDLSTKNGLKRGRRSKKVTHTQLQQKTESLIEPMEHRTLFLYGEERLSDKQKSRLNQLFQDSDPKGYVFEAWSQKEIVREALQKKDITLIDKAIRDAKESTHYLIKSFGKTLERWYEGIKNYMELKITNACTEAKNNIAKLFQRMAFGYRNKNNYVKKLYFCL